MFLGICCTPALCICGEAYCGLKEGCGLKERDVEYNLVRKEGEGEMMRTNEEKADDERAYLSSMQIKEEQELLDGGLLDEYYYYYY